MGFLFNLLVVASVTCHLSSSYRIKRSSVQFTDQEKQLLRSTWEGTIEPFSNQNAANLFIDYITKNPQLRKEFFWGRNDKSAMALRVDSKFTGHVYPVFAALGVGIKRLDNMDSVNRFYTSLGEDHIPRGVYPELFAPLADSFVYILELALGDAFTPAVKAAYLKYYTHVTGLMTAGLMGGDAVGLEGITAGEKAAAEAGWDKFAEDLEGNGAATFITLVHEHPEIRSVFPWGGKQVLSVDDADIRRHAELVFGGVGVAFKRIDHIHSLDGYYESLGLKHIARQAEVEFFDWIGDALHETFKQILGAGYTADFTSGANKVYGYLTTQMTAGLRGSGELTKAEKSAVREGFAKVSDDLGLFGAKVFAKLITMHPDIRSKFPWGSKALGADALIQDKDVQRHGDQVFRAFSLTIGNLDDITALSDYYYNEGLEHIVRNIDTEDFQKLLDAMLSVLSNELGALYTKDFKRGIESLYSFTVENMQRGMRGEKHLSKAERNEAAAAWNIFEANLVENGVDVFLNLIDEHPTLEHVFPWGNKGLTVAALRNDPEIKRHANLVFSAITPAFSKLDNLGSLNNFYLDIGNNHLDRNIPPVTFSFLSDAFKKTFNKILGPDYTESFAKSFDYVYAFITSRMLEGMSGIQTLSDVQKNAIRSAFKKFAEDLQGNGILVFLKFVHDYPNLLHVFPWGNHPEVDFEDMFQIYKDVGKTGLNRAQLAVYPEMAKHASQVFGGLQAAVDGIDHLDSLAQYYNALGVRHIPRGATPEQFLWMGDAIIFGFKDVLGSGYSSDFETGFHILYNFITKHLNDGLGGGVVLTASEKSALVAGFNAAKADLGKIGANAFVNLIEGDASYRKRFPWAARNSLSPAELRSDAGAIAHGEKVLHGVAVAVKNLDNLNAFVPYFIDEGVRHVPRLVTEEDFRAMAEALLPAFEAELGNLYTNDFKNALVALINFIADNMAKGLNIAGQRDIHLDVAEIKDVQTAFYKLGDIGEFGARVFGRLVHDHPQIRSYFPWGRNDLNENELVSHPATIAHAVQVFGTLFKVVEGADNLNDYRSFLTNKGLHHIPRGVKAEHFSWLKVALESELQQELGAEFTAAGRSGFSKVYDFVQQSMVNGLGGSTAVTFAQKVALDRGWGIFEADTGANGAKVFIQLIKNHPSFRPFFPWGRNDKTYSELLVDPAVHKHAEQVFGGLGAAIHHADNLDATRKYYHDLGVNHLDRAVRSEHFPPLQDALEAVLAELLGDLYTNDFVAGFEMVYGFVANHMTAGLGDSTDLSSQEREMVLDAFSVMRQDLDKNIADTFLYLIQQYPHLKKEFPWGEIPTNQLRSSDAFMNHILAVFKGLGVAVDRLGDLASTTNYYISLGQNHITRGATDAAFNAIGQSLLHTFRGLMGPKYNSKFVTAFNHVYDFIVGNMKVGISGQEDLSVVELTAGEQAAVKSGMAKLDLGDFGREVFIKFIADHPETRNIFPWGRNALHFDALRHSQAAYAHADTVFSNLAVAVSRIDNLGTLTDFYTALGVHHIPRHLEHKHFSWMGEAINFVLNKRLGADYTADFQSGFDKIYSFVTGRMERGMTSGKSLTAAQKEEVSKAWALFEQNLADNGAAVFAKFVTKYPQYTKVFPWGGNANDENGYRYDAETRAHAEIVFGALGELLKDVNELKNQRKDLVALGRRHIPRNVTLEQLLRLGVVLDEYFEELLGADASLDFRLGFDIVYANVIDSMSAGLQI